VDKGRILPLGRPKHENREPNETDRLRAACQARPASRAVGSPDLPVSKEIMILEDGARTRHALHVLRVAQRFLLDRRKAV